MTILNCIGDEAGLLIAKIYLLHITHFKGSSHVIGDFRVLDMDIDLYLRLVGELKGILESDLKTYARINLIISHKNKLYDISEIISNIKYAGYLTNLDYLIRCKVFYKKVPPGIP